MTNKPGSIAFPSKIGVFWNSEPWPIIDAQRMSREIEALGFGSLFMPEGGGKDVLVQSAALLGATERLVVGTGIANIHVRLPSAAESGARMLTALHPGWFVLGLGVSHAPFVENSTDGAYRKPLSTMRTYLERMNSVPAELEAGARPTRLLAAKPRNASIAAGHTTLQPNYGCSTRHQQRRRRISHRQHDRPPQVRTP